MNTGQPARHRHPRRWPRSARRQSTAGRSASPRSATSCASTSSGRRRLRLRARACAPTPDRKIATCSQAMGLRLVQSGASVHAVVRRGGRIGGGPEGRGGARCQGQAAEPQDGPAQQAAGARRRRGADAAAAGGDGRRPARPAARVVRSRPSAGRMLCALSIGRWSLARSGGRMVCRAGGRSIGRSVCRTVRLSVGRSGGRRGRSVGRSAGRSGGGLTRRQSAGWSVG